MFQQPKDKVRASGSRAGDSFWQEEKAAGNFGLKMMAGMGWEQGKGLGKNEDGQKQYLRAKYKADSKGIGATEKQEDATWRVTQDLYSEMLQRVKAEQAAAAAAAAAAGGSASPTNEVSLEVTETTTGADGSNTTTTISQRIRTKTLYSRFKKSKDTANYSATAMSEIFGRKPDPATMTVGIWGKPGTSAVRDSRAPKAEAADADVKVKKEESAAPQGNENLSTSKLSIRDYFAAKLAAAGKLGGMSAAQFAGKQETKIKTEAMDQEDDERHGGLGLGHAHPITSAAEPAAGGARGFTEDQQESYYARMMATAIGGKGVSTGRSARVGLGFGGAGYGANAPASAFTSGLGAKPATSALISANKSVKLRDDDDSAAPAPMRIDTNLAATIEDERPALSPVAAYEEDLIDAAAVNERKQHKKEKKRKRQEQEAEAEAAAAAAAATVEAEAPKEEVDEKAAKKARKAAKREAEARAAAEAEAAAQAAASAEATAADSDAERKEAKKAKKAAKKAKEAEEAAATAAAAAAAAADEEKSAKKQKKKKKSKEESD